MDEKSVVASLALHAVLEPIFEEVSLWKSLVVYCLEILMSSFPLTTDNQLEGDDRHIAAVHTLRSAFTKVSACYFPVS